MTRPIHPIKLSVFVLLLSALPGAVRAQTADPAEGSYLGLGAGVAHSADFNRGPFDLALQAQTLTVRTTSVEDRDTGWNLYAGYRLGPHWAVEGGYTSLGRYRYEGQVVQDPGTVQATFKAEVWKLAVLAILPLGGDFEVLGKAGSGYWHTRLDSQGNLSGRSAKPAEARGYGSLLGLGVGWRISDRLSARAEWERFGRVGQADRTGRVDIDFASVGLRYHF
jgi:OOP family OmpA-OmpF porin